MATTTKKQIDPRKLLPVDPARANDALPDRLDRDVGPDAA
jgi:hypothetical protein